MRSRLSMVLVLFLAACESGGSDQGQESEQSGQETESEQTAPAGNEQAETPPAEADAAVTPPAEPFEGMRNGRFESERFNVRIMVPGDWHQTTSQTADSVTFEGPGDIQMIVANSESLQLVDGNFSNLNDRVSFDQVNLLPDRSQTGPVNGIPGYRVEGDAILRGQDLPIYFVSQAVNVPGEPVMVTIFIPGDNYFEHSDTMHAVLDSIEALDLRPN